MEHFNRLFGILLTLQRTKAISAGQLARQFEVSTRTIYRDLQMLSALGVPIYTERGHNGGIRLLEGYFLPPLTFSEGEAVALLLGLTFLQRLHTFPFPEEVKTAVQKLLVAVPESLRITLAQVEKVIGFEQLPNDIFHPELVSQTEGNSSGSQIITTFLQAILTHSQVQLLYKSPYHQTARQAIAVIPLGLFWDRNHWYLAGMKGNEVNLWRAERVSSLKSEESAKDSQKEFDIQKLLGHVWLKAAMEQWQHTFPVVIRLTRYQAERLQQDWYYQHARFEALTDTQILMTIGEENQTIVFELIRWLGPRAELIAPEAWRVQLKDELQQMLSLYE